MAVPHLAQVTEALQAQLAPPTASSKAYMAEDAIKRASGQWRDANAKHDQAVAAVVRCQTPGRSRIEVDETTQEECETLAAEAQKLGWKAARHRRKSNNKQAREKMAQSKSNRGWRATYSERGSIMTGSKEAEEKLQKIETRTQIMPQEWPLER